MKTAHHNRTPGPLTGRRRGTCAHAIAILTTTAALAACTPQTSDRSLVEIPRSEVASLISRDAGDILLIDARRPEAFDAGTIPGAVNRNPRDFQPEHADTRMLDRYGRVIVFGENPGSVRARALAKKLIRLDVVDVYWYAGGYEEWSGQALR